MRSKSSEPDGDVLVDGTGVLRLLAEIDPQSDLATVRDKITTLKQAVLATDSLQTDGEAHARREVLLSELDQILEARTIERARYYLKRLERGISKVRTGKINDINLHRWKEYSEVITDSLWVLERRDGSGAHLGWYWGNFIPQIPHQLMLRYTKRGDWVLDPFVGSGTTLIECRRLGRNGIGIELNTEVSHKAVDRIRKQGNPHSVTTEVVIADSQTVDYQSLAARFNIDRVQLVIMHPPYHDIVKFSGEGADLSNAASVEAFLKMFASVVERVTPLLERGRYLGLVIGDKYSKGEWVPLGFYCMERVLELGYALKSVVVKNFDQTRAKREQKELWRYRALVGGFYVFKHEYIFLFEKASSSD
jgi:hypothetical protein